MPPKPHLQIYESACPQRNGHRLQEFHLFSDLPLEIRFKIWRNSMEYGRIIRIHLRMRIVIDALLAQEGKTRPDTFDEHSPVVQGYQVLSKLLRVNRESREAALSFYRVHVPCWLTRGASRQDSLVSGIIYYNPEFDFIDIKQDNKELVEFFYDLKTKYDPCRVGIINLALDHNQMNVFGLISERLSDYNSAQQEAFKEIILQLQEVFFVFIQRTSRPILDRDAAAVVYFECTYNRSFPITGAALNFDRVCRDPRPIANDLADIHIFSGPRGMYASWQKFLKVLDLNPGHIQYRTLLAFNPVGSENAIFDRKSAERWLQKEADMWPFDMWPGNYHGDGPLSARDAENIPAAQLERFQSEDLDKTVRPAFGFWLFPLEAFDQPPEDAGMNPKRAKWNLTDHWPELALLRLPS